MKETKSTRRNSRELFLASGQFQAQFADRPIQTALEQYDAENVIAGLRIHAESSELPAELVAVDLLRYGLDHLEKGKMKLQAFE